MVAFRRVATVDCTGPEAVPTESSGDCAATKPATQRAVNKKQAAERRQPIRITHLRSESPMQETCTQSAARGKDRSKRWTKCSNGPAECDEALNLAG